ncbi:hypothetical protein ACLBV5_09840 [Brevundimonas sp. M1A4_2e]
MITRDLLNHLATITGDKALLNAFKIKNPEFVGLCEAIAARDLRDEKPIGSFPVMGDLTAIQIAVFDNGPPKGRGTRYGLAVEFWTKPDVNVKKKNFDRKANVILLDAKGLKSWLKRTIDANHKRRFPLSADFLERLIEFQANMAQNEYLGLLCEKKAEFGTIYYDDQMVHVRLDGEDTRMVLFLGDDIRVLPRFSKTDRRGNEHGGNVILQSRCDIIGFDDEWATDDFEEIVDL